MAAHWRDSPVSPSEDGGLRGISGVLFANRQFSRGSAMICSCPAMCSACSSRTRCKRSFSRRSQAFGRRSVRRQGGVATKASVARDPAASNIDIAKCLCLCPAKSLPPRYKVSEASVHSMMSTAREKTHSTPLFFHTANGLSR